MIGQQSTQSLAFATGIVLIAAVAASCGTGGAAALTSGGMSGAAATQVAAGASQTAVAVTATIVAKTIGSQTILVAGSNGMTVYTFANDTAGSGMSSCTGACLAKWPPVTVALGASATAGAGVTGEFGTITRSDTGALQVTRDGLPLYFFAGDSVQGDTNGSYPNWNLVKP